MNQANHVIQGFMLALLLPVIGIVSNKLLSSQDQHPAVENFTQMNEVKAEPIMSEAATKGKSLFNQKCAACHSLYKTGTGPQFCGIEKRGPWSDRKNLYAWIRNPAGFMQNDSYTTELKERFGSVMTAFPNLTDDNIDNIMEYVKYACALRGY